MHTKICHVQLNIFIGHTGAPVPLKMILKLLFQGQLAAQLCFKDMYSHVFQTIKMMNRWVFYRRWNAPISILCFDMQMNYALICIPQKQKAELK